MKTSNIDYDRPVLPLRVAARGVSVKHQLMYEL